MKREFFHAARQLVRAPRFTVLVVATLALSLGAATSLSSLVNALLIRELPVPAPDQVIAVYPLSKSGTVLGYPYATLARLAERQQALASLCGFTRGPLKIELGQTVSTHASEAVGGSCYEMWGVKPFLGRLIGEPEAPLLTDPAPVVVVSHSFWRRVLNADPAAIGRTLPVEGVPLTVIGVTPPGFTGLYADQPPELIVPVTLLPRLTRTLTRIPWATARLSDRVSAAAAKAQLEEIWPEVWTDTNPKSASAAVPPLKIEPLARGFSDLRDRYQSSLWALSGLAAVLLLLACLNVSALFLTRVIGRRHDYGVQLALGATLRRLRYQVVSEAAIVSLAAAAAALPLGVFFSKAMADAIWTGNLPFTMSVAPDARVSTALIALALMVGACISVAPLVMIGRIDLRSELANGRTVASGISRWRKGLVVAQTATSLVLVFCAALFAANLQQIRQIDPGYDRDGIMWTRLERLPAAPREIDPVSYLSELARRIAELPEVSDAGFSVNFPTAALSLPLASIGRPADGNDGPEVQGSYDLVSPGFFSVAGISLLAGRDFTWQDTVKQQPVAIVNRTLVSKLFPDGDALGQQIRVGRPPAGRISTIVGIVEDASTGDARLAGVPALYTALLQTPALAVTPNMVMRTTTAAGLFDGIQRAIAPLKRHHIMTLRTMDEQMDRLLARERILSDLSSTFASLGLLIAGLGLYALLAYSVVRRTREFGIRMALGATGRGLAGTVIFEGGVLLAGGIVLGLPLSLAAGRAAAVLLWGTSPFNGVILAAALLILIAGATAALISPAFRVARTDVVHALRYE